MRRPGALPPPPVLIHHSTFASNRLASSAGRFFFFNKGFGDQTCRRRFFRTAGHVRAVFSDSDMSAALVSSFPPAVADLPVRDTVWATLLARAEAYPALPAATLIFLLAIIHTFAAPKFLRLAHDLEKKADEAGRPSGFAAGVCHFLGEVEAVFGIWAVAIFALLAAWPGLGWQVAAGYVDGRNYAEAVFVVVIMTMAATRPVVTWAGLLLGKAASLGRGTPLAWWLAILILAPLLGSLITEPAAMTLAAMLLLRRFYAHLPSDRLAYATLGLLFVNVSVGGTLTNFAAPPVLMVAGADAWNWSVADVFSKFGAKALVGIVLATLVIGRLFRREFAAMALRAAETDAIAADRDDTEPAPFRLFLVHAAFMAWTVLMLLMHHTALMVAGLLFFLAFVTATRDHQRPVSLRPALLVGFFLAGLIVHGGLQGWWIGPVLGSLGKWPLFLGSAGLTAFNDNAAITYLATQVPALASPADGAAISDSVRALRFAVVAGAVTGGGLTLIANAPNPAGAAILSAHFRDGISPLKLFLAALAPTVIVGATLMLMPN